MKHIISSIMSQRGKKATDDIPWISSRVHRIVGLYTEGETENENNLSVTEQFYSYYVFIYVNGKSKRLASFEKALITQKTPATEVSLINAKKWVNLVVREGLTLDTHLRIGGSGARWLFYCFLCIFDVSLRWDRINWVSRCRAISFTGVQNAAILFIIPLSLLQCVNSVILLLVSSRDRSLIFLFVIFFPHLRFASCRWVGSRQHCSLCPSIFK